MTTLPEYLELLRQKIGFECVQQSMGAQRIYLFGRIRGQSYDTCGLYGTLLLRVALSEHWRSNGWTIDPSELWVLKGQQLTLAKGMRFIFTCTAGDSAQLLEQAMQVLLQCPIAKTLELSSFPLSGASADRNSPAGPGRRGATLYGQTIIGTGRR